MCRSAAVSAFNVAGRHLLVSIAKEGQWIMQRENIAPLPVNEQAIQFFEHVCYFITNSLNVCVAINRVNIFK